MTLIEKGFDFFCLKQYIIREKWYCCQKSLLERSKQWKSNVIYNELRLRGFSVDVGVIKTREQGVRKQLEVDFVCNLGSKRYYIQSVYSMPSEEKRNQEIRPFTKIDDSFKKIVNTGDMSPTYYNDDGVLFMNIFDFLLKPENLNK